MGGFAGFASLNVADLTARRDLGVAFLDLRLPGCALSWLDEAKRLDPRKQEIAYLRGLALLGKRRCEEAVRAFGEAIGIDPETGEPFSSGSSETTERTFRRYGEAYLGAGEALERLGRLEQAEAALEMSATCNTSSLEPLVRLACVRQRMGNAAGAQNALREARTTWGQLPGFLKRRQLGLYVRALIG